MQAERIFGNLDDLPEIVAKDDLQPYWDAVIRKVLFLQGPLVPVLSRVLRTIGAIDILRFHPNKGRDLHYDESLRYLVRHLYHGERALGNSDSSDLSETTLVGRIILLLGEMALVRDHIESARLGYSDVSIDAARRLVRFTESADSQQDIRRREYRELREGFLLERERPTEYVQHSVEQILAAVENPALLLAPAERFEDLVKLVMQVNASLSSSVDTWLPDDLDLGCYCAGHFRLTSDYLFAVADAHGYLLGSRIEKDPLFPLLNHALIVADSDFIAGQASRVAGVPKSAAAEIVRDLTYSVKVKNSSPFIQPLLPVGNSRVVTIPRLLLRGGDWVGILLRILERLPWRREARDRFGAVRESLMQRVLEGALTSLGVEARRNIKVGPRQSRIGDIDLLIFAPEENLAIAASLKWFYPPDLVQECANQTQRISEAVKRHLVVTRAMREQYTRLSSVYRLPSRLDVRPLVVVQPGPIFERARNLGVNVVSGQEFLEVASTSTNFSELVERLEHYSPPAVTLTALPNQKVWLGKYRFELPRYYIPKSERSRLEELY